MLVSAGGTREPIDSVRYIGNRSSGRMGVALAEAAAERGSRVALVTGEQSRCRRRPTSSAATSSRPPSFARGAARGVPRCDVLLMAAAVADFTPAAPHAGKIRKSGREGLRIELEATEDVLSGLAGSRADTQTIVGFAAEHGPEAVAGARQAGGQGLDAIVVNDISREDIGFDVDANEVTILTAADRGRPDPVPPLGDPRPGDGVAQCIQGGRSPTRSSTQSSAFAHAAKPTRAARRLKSRMESVYDLYQRGCELLDHGDYQAAIVPLSKARDLEPEKASIREALGRALFHARR